MSPLAAPGWAGEALLGAGAAALAAPAQLFEHLIRINQSFEGGSSNIAGRIGARLCLLIEFPCLCLNSSAVRGGSSAPSAVRPQQPRPPPRFGGDIWCCRLSSSITAPIRCHRETRRNKNKRRDKFVLFSFIINQNISLCSKAWLLINRQARGYF